MAKEKRVRVWHGVTSGKTYQVDVDSPLGRGAMKCVYPTKDGKHVVARFFGKISPSTMSRLRNGLDQLIRLHDRVNADASTRDYWNKVIVWPEEFISSSEKGLAFVMPIIPKNFRFKKSEVTADSSTWVGMDKSAFSYATVNRFRSIAPSAWGTLRDHFKIAEHLARAIRAISQGGRSYGDISLNNVLVDPATASMTLIDMDNVTVNCDVNRSVKGTSGYQAPEVYFDSQVPTSSADYFSLAVMIYKLLHLRHPFLKNPFNNDNECQQQGDGKICKADFVYIENEQEHRSHYPWSWVEQAVVQEQQLHRQGCISPWWNLEALPSRRVVGKPMAEMFTKTFVEKLFDPEGRPSAENWERMIIRTQGRLIDCANPDCHAKAFVFDASNVDRVQRKLVCPFCGTPIAESVLGIQVLEDNSDRGWRIMVQASRPRSVLKWELDPRGGEYLDHAELSEPQADVRCIDGAWRLRNLSGTPISVVDASGQQTCLYDGGEATLSKGMRFYKVKGREFVVVGRI